jgi:uncharacterized protein (DUF488 family)
MPRQLFTIGYEGAGIDAFVEELLANDIDWVLDVRAVPLSRKPGFSKNQLLRRLEQSQIRYVHLAELGTPKPIREDLKSTGDYSTFFRKMEKYLSGKKKAIETAYDYVVRNTCCLMCFERLPACCHRKIVAQKIKDRDGNGLQIVHI